MKVGQAIDSAREIREYFIPDFSDWKDHDEYQKALGRLMWDLKVGGEGRKGKLEIRRQNVEEKRPTSRPGPRDARGRRDKLRSRL